jgi:hypothetical protein
MFKHPFTMIISGSTGSGKTEWLMKFLRQLDLLIGEITHVLYCYGELNRNIIALEKMGSDGKAVKFTVHNGVPSEEDVRNLARKEKLLLVLDDLLVNLKSQYLDTVFTRGSHNWGVSVILVTQHMFNKELKTARNNTHYLVLMRNPAGELQVRNLATQLFPNRSKYFLEAYKDATKEQFSYLVIDMHPSTEDILRLKTHIYPDELPIVYVPKG